MSLVEHARRELELSGQFEEDPAYAQSVVAAVAAFASYGHSGGSAACAVGQIVTLLRYGTLSPLTNSPDEWNEVAAEYTSGPTTLWQSQRNPEAFSEDGGRTYYLLSEVDAAREAAAKAAERPMRTSRRCDVTAADQAATAPSAVNCVAEAPASVAARR